MKPALTTHDAHSLLEVFSNGLARHGQTGDLFIYGGAALGLGLGLRETMGDIDGTADRALAATLWNIEPAMLEGGALARSDGDHWLHIHTGVIERFIARPGIFFDPYKLENGALRVHLLKPGPQLALKFERASRIINDKDEPAGALIQHKDGKDILALAAHLDLSTPRQMQKLWDAYAPMLPGRDMPPIAAIWEALHGPQPEARTRRIVRISNNRQLTFEI